MATQKPRRAPLSDTIVIAVARLVDDAQTGTREPSHSAIEFAMERAGLKHADPNREGKPVGKAKRVRGVLTWALDNDAEKGEAFVGFLLAHVRGCGGFVEGNTNYVGTEVVQVLRNAFRSEGYEFFADGDYRPLILESLSGKDLTSALQAYVRRAKQGATDAALLTGTGKDLLEATAAHVIDERFGAPPNITNFPTVLAQAFMALGLAVPDPKKAPAGREPANIALERAMYELACAVNRLRNQQGTGHGRPFGANVSDIEAKAAVESIGVISEFLLGKLGV
jgi:hypothetical protein